MLDRRWRPEFGEDGEMIRQELAALRQSAVAMFRKRFERAVKDGELPNTTDCKGLARYVATPLNGLAVQAASGTSEKDLRQVVATAMLAWPS